MDSEVSAIVKQMQKIRNEQGELNEEETILWRRFFDIADDIAGANQNHRYVEPKLKLYIAREMHQQTPSLNVAQLEATLTPEQWKLVTRQQRVFSMAHLEDALAKGLVDRTLVESFMETKPSVPHRRFGPATKGDLESLNASSS